jgi:hypothetical protein
LIYLIAESVPQAVLSVSLVEAPVRIFDLFEVWVPLKLDPVGLCIEILLISGGIRQGNKQFIESFLHQRVIKDFGQAPSLTRIEHQKVLNDFLHARIFCENRLGIVYLILVLLENIKELLSLDTGKRKSMLLISTDLIKDYTKRPGIYKINGRRM